jgi:hypothetical protein
MIQELGAQEFVDMLRKNAAWLVTQDLMTDRLILVVRATDEDTEPAREEAMFYGPHHSSLSYINYTMFVYEVTRIVAEKGA